MSFSDPEHNIAQFSLQAGNHVADFGSGTGFYTFAIAKAVTGAGKVYAVDVQKDLLTKLKNEAQRRMLNNVEIIWADIEKPNGTHLRNDMLDAVVVSNLLFQVENKESAIHEAKRLLKAKGRILLIDWSDSFGGMGPSFDKILSEDKAKALFEKNGFTFQSKIQAGGHHYGLIFKKS